MTELPDKLLCFLREGTTALLLTIGEDAFPNTAYTWALAPDAKRIRFAVDHGKETSVNLQRNENSALQIVGYGNLLFLLKGRSRVIKEKIEAVPFPMAMLEMRVVKVKDQSWAGVTVDPLCYQWPEAQRAEMQEMEKAVYAEILSIEI